MQVSAPLDSTAGSSDGVGLGNIFISKVTNVDQAGNYYANWVYTFNLAGTGGLQAGTIIGEIDLLNNTSWSPNTTTATNPTELILPAGAVSQTYKGVINGGTGPYLGATGKLSKVKNSTTSWRTYTLTIQVPN